MFTCTIVLAAVPWCSWKIDLSGLTWLSLCLWRLHYVALLSWTGSVIQLAIITSDTPKAWWIHSASSRLEVKITTVNHIKHYCFLCMRSGRVIRASNGLVTTVVGSNHRLNIELDLQSLLELHVHSCTHCLRPPASPTPSHLGSYIRGRYCSAKIDDISLVTSWFKPRILRRCGIWGAENEAVFSKIKFHL